MEIITDLATGYNGTITIGAGITAFSNNKLLRAGRDDDDRGKFKGSKCKAIFATLETDQIRFWLNGEDPSSSVGHLMDVGDNLTLSNIYDIENFRATRVTADATLSVSYKF